MNQATRSDAPSAGPLEYHRLCAAADVAEGESRPFSVNGTHLALFRYRGRFHAVDNRCPHMGYPMSKGSIRDGVLICHWHHWEFDLDTGGCFLTSGDDLKTSLSRSGTGACTSAFPPTSARPRPGDS